MGDITILSLVVLYFNKDDTVSCAPILGLNDIEIQGDVDLSRPVTRLIESNQGFLDITPSRIITKNSYRDSRRNIYVMKSGDNFTTVFRFLPFKWVQVENRTIRLNDGNTFVLEELEDVYVLPYT